jgi:dipeptidyl aminopeptidase/acylaminoacyl peptidase
MRPTATLATLLLVLCAPGLAAQAPAALGQPAERAADRLTLDMYLQWEDVQNPQLSPDGRQILYTRRWINPVDDRWDSQVWIMNADGSRARYLTDGSSPLWSPDGTRIAYLADGQPRGPQIHVRWMDAEGATSQVTRLTDRPSSIAWSPDGSTIAFNMLVPDRQRWRVNLPPRPQGARWAEDPLVIERMHYRRERLGYTPQGHQHIFVVSADGGAPRQVTSGDWNHGSPEWTPDGRGILFTSHRVEDAERRWRETGIYRVDVGTRAVTRLTDYRGPKRNVVASPDGRRIAFAGYPWTPDTYREWDLYVMDADGSNLRALTRSLDRSPAGITWAEDGRGIYFNVDDQGTRNLYHATLDGQVRPVTTGSHMLTVSDIRRGTAVGTRTNFHEPAHVVAFNLRRPEPRALVRSNEELLRGVRLGEVEELWWESVGGVRAHGWLVKPPDFDPTRQYPLQLEIHGGPHAMYNVGFSFSRQEHAANGYLVLYTNPRGSSGYGTAFGNAINNAYPGDDYHDLMGGVDAVIARGIVDESNMFVYGCSGGGVLTAWVVGHTDRFAAASSNCPVTNWLSFVGTTDGTGWYRNFENFFWEDPSEHLRRSPIMYVGNVKTPTMLMTGERDLRTPMAQTEEYYQALQVLGVPTAMIRFPDEWHGTSSRPSNFLRTQLYLRSWFERHGTMDTRRPVADRAARPVPAGLDETPEQ